MSGAAIVAGNAGEAGGGVVLIRVRRSPAPAIDGQKREEIFRPRHTLSPFNATAGADDWRAHE